MTDQRSDTEADIHVGATCAADTARYVGRMLDSKRLATSEQIRAASRLLAECADRLALAEEADAQAALGSDA